jgi:hypothetical protein
MAPWPRIVEAKRSREEAELCANAEAKSITTMIDYWWGREKDSHEIHRFGVRPAKTWLGACEEPRS